MMRFLLPLAAFIVLVVFSAYWPESQSAAGSLPTDRKTCPRIPVAAIARFG